MKTRKELEDKAIELQKRIWDLETCWQPSKADVSKIEILKTAYTTIMYVLGYKQESIYFDCNKYVVS